MKRLSGSDSETQSVFDDEFQSMLEEEYSGNGENIQMGQSEKKRRLSVVQVKALEKNFELENKLEPERKVKLAQELGLQPRQVAVWFQNRRARWKTKQLEKDYGVLKNQYDSLRHNFDSLRRDNDALLQEITKMKAKINGQGISEEENNNLTATATTTTAISNISGVKEEETSLPETNPSSPSSPSSPPLFLEHSTCFNYRRSFTDLRDLLPSDSCDSSAVINDETSSDNGRLTPPALVSDGNFFKFVKMEHTTEDHDDFLSGEEACGFFSDEQPPSLHWWT